MPIPLAAIQAFLGLGQFIAGAEQRRKAEKAAQEQIGKLGPDIGILGFYNRALQRYSGLQSGEGALQKQYERQAQRNLASNLRMLRETGTPGSILAGGSAALRAANEGALRAAATGQQQAGQALGMLGSASQLAAAEKRRPEELRLQMQLQRAAGGSQVANVGLSNVFGALQSAATQKMYKDIYGGETSAAKLPRNYVQGTGTGMLNLFPTPSTAMPTSAQLSRASGVVPRATPSTTLRQFNVPRILPRNLFSGPIYPFPTYPY